MKTKIKYLEEVLERAKNLLNKRDFYLCILMTEVLLGQPFNSPEYGVIEDKFPEFMDWIRDKATDYNWANTDIYPTWVTEEILHEDDGALYEEEVDDAYAILKGLIHPKESNYEMDGLFEEVSSEEKIKALEEYINELKNK